MLQQPRRKQPVVTWLQGNTLSLKRLASVRPWLGRRRFWSAALAGTVAIAGGATALNLSRSAKQARSLSAYTAVAQEGSLPGLVTASGELEAFRLVNVSPKRQGVLKTLYVEEGDSVRAGQALALMDGGDLTDRLEELSAQLQSAKAQLARSQSELQRRENLVRNGAISQDNYNSAKATYLVDRAAVDAAQQRLEQREMERSELIVRAPSPGLLPHGSPTPGPT